MKSFEFKAGDYVVLTRSCLGNNNWKDSIPENYVYRLKRDSNNFNFSIERDIRSNDYFGNGWSIEKGDRRYVEMRLATEEEKVAYIAAGNKPVPAIPESVNEINESYEIF